MKFLYPLISLVIFAVLLTACGDAAPPPLMPSPPVDAPATEQPPSPAPDEPLPTAESVLPPAETTVPEPVVSIPMPLMGAETHRPGDATVLSLLSDSGARIVRYNGILWSDVEPQEGQYNWDALTSLETAMQELSARGIEIIMIVRGTPEWAQKVPGSACGPVKEAKFGAFANFLAALVQRYSAPPYNVRYWELGNEPDVDVKMMPGDSIFGCWGDADDSFYGGGYYADMLKVVYPAVKSANPDAQVLIGGLLLDCDPGNPPEGRTCQSTRFFDGILDGGGAAYFDIVSFHGYPFYAQQSLKFDELHPNWISRGGVVVGKINYLRDAMHLYGVDKPLFLTEGSLICPEWNPDECVPPDAIFFEKQADHVVRMFVRNWALDVRGTIWYQFEGRGWRYGGLVGENPENPNPAFRAFRFLNAKMANMHYVGDVPLPEGMVGYAFQRDDRQTWVVWSADETAQRFPLPEGVFVIYDRDGDEIAPANAGIDVSSPIYIDFLP